MNSNFQCMCCQPPRRIYLRISRLSDDAYHKRDHTPAQQAPSDREIKRQQRASRHSAGQQPAQRSK